MITPAAPALTPVSQRARAEYQEEPWNAVAWLYQEAKALFGPRCAAALTLEAQHRAWAYGI